LRGLKQTRQADRDKANAEVDAKQTAIAVASMYRDTSSIEVVGKLSERVKELSTEMLRHVADE
jgi:hypothetical protein